MVGVFHYRCRTRRQCRSRLRLAPGRHRLPVILKSVVLCRICSKARGSLPASPSCRLREWMSKPSFTSEDIDLHSLCSDPR